MDRNFNNNANNDMNNNINNEVNGNLKCNIAPDIDNTFKNVEKITDDVKNDIHKIDKDNPTLHPDGKETNPMFKSGNNQDEPMPNPRHIDISLKDSISRVSAANIVENPENSKESNSNKVIDPVSTLSPEQRKVYNTALDGYVFILLFISY